MKRKVASTSIVVPKSAAILVAYVEPAYGRYGPRVSHMTSAASGALSTNHS